MYRQLISTSKRSTRSIFTQYMCTVPRPTPVQQPLVTPPVPQVSSSSIWSSITSSYMTPYTIGALSVVGPLLYIGANPVICAILPATWAFAIIREMNDNKRNVEQFSNSKVVVCTNPDGTTTTKTVTDTSNGKNSYEQTAKTIMNGAVKITVIWVLGVPLLIIVIGFICYVGLLFSK